MRTVRINKASVSTSVDLAAVINYAVSINGAAHCLGDRYLSIGSNDSASDTFGKVNGSNTLIAVNKVIYDS